MTTQIKVEGPPRIRRDAIPTRALLDRSLLFFLEGYTFTIKRYHRWRARAFETRLLARRSVVMAGRDATSLFYDADRIVQSRFVPWPIRTTLFGAGAVHFLEGEEHRHRKAMFMSMVTEESVAALAAATARRWDAASDRWEAADRVVLFDEAVQVLGSAAFTWAGIPVERTDEGRRARDLATIVDGFGSLGLRHLRARMARRRADRWARRLIADVRAGRLHPPVGSPLEVIARHRGLDGRPMGERLAATELLNVVRPTVAVAYFVTFAALAMHTHPEWRPRLATGDEAVLEAFAHEVRRYYPFAPALGAKVRREFTWQGRRFPRGRVVMLDVFGTDRDAGSWADPERFDPERFIGREPDNLAWVPHGDGEPYTSHRCAGEGVTTELLKTAERYLARLRYDIPRQDLRVPLNRIPTRPPSGFIMTNVRRILVPAGADAGARRRSA
ncbi:cytochrome P450 [Planosporangium flavigriseum]|uniref:Fatty-acid peroxygenase n=1 Tax=Planosporangium flavigriseum TaxID=373681 RepID=A0A8J3PP80_9ACTN|nr:cytochrome P450 [Planosporangium flavigriseum]NJC65912.1 cytochrome P450 [Planosporangium flavigriseum]GIG75618.1 fatty-acid peroxygenase [Planosporangium flavigriseum]